ncbi:MAG: peptidylprolyl isomerase [Saccharospirillaceae bacterium]|nr:peptidylprolyl isomerase [Pseudomonadales bacterium]NRB80547.1 peptidylprolyl isomerase [Saccharospirillaceae bacterium]
MATAGVRHILVKTAKEAEQLKKQLNQGQDFSKLAKKHSLCPTGKKAGGDLGVVKPGQMVKAFDKAVFKGKELELQGPVKTQFGYHVIQVLYRG